MNQLSRLLALALCSQTLWVGCASTELEELRTENERLRTLVEELQARLEGSGPPIPDFNVALATEEEDFDESQFVDLLEQSLGAASSGSSRSFEVASENSPDALAKFRGLLIQKHLSEERVPIEITELSYKLSSPEAEFSIGGTPVPRDGAIAERDADGFIRVSYTGPLDAHLTRDTRGEFGIAFADSGGGSGIVPLDIAPEKLFASGDEARFVRQGDLSLQWQLDLERLSVFRIADFRGDVGLFMHHMRYPRSSESANRYQTLRDSAFLFAYGPYPTGLIQRMETPSYIDRVEVLPLDAELFESLEPGLSEDVIEQLTAGVTASWTGCELAESDERIKSWERPVGVEVPFLSRQVSSDKRLVFYTKYDEEGPTLVGDYTLRGGR